MTAAHHHPTGPSEAGSVVADIGGDVGAAVVRVAPALAADEIEIRADGAAWDGTHVAVRERHVAAGVIHAAFFPALAQGCYEVRRRGDPASPVKVFSVDGGRVSDTTLV
jgi:hypothetical protein